MREDTPVRLSMAGTAALAFGFCAIDMTFVLDEHPPAGRLLFAGACFVMLFCLQLCHSFPDLFRLPYGARYVTLTVQAVLSFAPDLLFGQAFLGMPQLFAASALLMLSPAVAWPVSTLAIAGNLWVVVLVGDGGDLWYDAAEMALNATILYGFSRYSGLIAAVHRARVDLARQAVSAERLRFARDLDDLLGISLSTITLKSELSARLLPDRPQEARDEITEMLATSRKALSDVRSVARSYRPLSLTEALESARSVLTADGITANLRLSELPRLAPATETALASVLREGLTNVLRHSVAERCTISLAVSDGGGTITLKILNDGVRAEQDHGREDAGTLAVLADRVERLSGTLVARRRGDWFHLVVRVPAASDPGLVERPAGTGLWSVTRATVPAVRTASALTIAILAFYLMQGVTNTSGSGVTGGRLALAAAIVTAGVLLLAWQIFSAAAKSSALRRVLLVVQLLLAFVPYAYYGDAWADAAGLAAGTALLVLPRPLSWLTYTGVVLGNQVILYELGLHDIAQFSYQLFMTAMTGLVVYGLSRLRDLVEEAHRTRAEQARLAVVSERLRFARDLHDLLGYSLSTITLKCELAKRLAVRRPEQARAEIGDVLTTSRQALADVRTVARGYRPMSLADEASSARSMLTAAGIRASLGLGHTAPLSPAADTVLATVLREALTNALRHSQPQECRISTADGSNGADGTVVLCLANDGAAMGDPRPDDAGSGIGNLTTRLRRLGGTLDVAHSGGTFTLTARVPHDARHAPARDDADDLGLDLDLGREAVAA
ncbi:histidine kinase [Streptomyces sp. L2]|uniref:sensor histidine kinase n=1 Tax=Streptomyces sp. L2 TaxID=2162665 RepID=UPI001010B64A|nr:histidine kinase [Streptomyces sp. L2]